MDFNIIFLNIFVMVIYGVFSIGFGDLYLVSKEKYYKFIFLILLEVINMILLFNELDYNYILPLIMIYFIFAYYGHIVKRLFIGMTAIMFIQIVPAIATGIFSFIDTYYIMIPVDYYFHYIYILASIILFIHYLVFRSMQSTYQFSSFKDLLLFLVSCILLNVSGYMIVNFPIANLDLVNLYSFLFIGLIEIIFVMFSLLTRRLNKSREELVKKEIESYSKTFNETMVKNIEESYKNNRKLKHDLNNHLLAIELRIKNGKQEEALDYIHKISQNVTGIKVVETENETLNYIINSKMMTMERHGIEFEYKMLSSLKQLEVFDIVTIMGNLLDNAIEAQHDLIEKRYIKLYTEDIEGRTIIEIRNRCNRDKLTIKDGEFISTKKDKDHHGIGLGNVREVIKKYNGEYKIDIQENEFVVWCKI